jgi:hypothetical protein
MVFVFVFSIWTMAINFDSPKYCQLIIENHAMHKLNRNGCAWPLEKKKTNYKKSSLSKLTHTATAKITGIMRLSTQMLLVLRFYFCSRCLIVLAG